MRLAVVSAIAEAWDEGCPVGVNNDDATADKLATFSERRMRSFERRANKARGRSARIDDLGKGLAQHFGDPRSWATPGKEDLRYLAAKIFDAAAVAPWGHARDLYPVGQDVVGVVADIRPFGIFVALPETEVPGVVLVPNLFPDHDPAEGRQWPKIGTSVRCIVIAHAAGRHQIDLSLAL